MYLHKLPAQCTPTYFAFKFIYFESKLNTELPNKSAAVVICFAVDLLRDFQLHGR